MPVGKNNFNFGQAGNGKVNPLQFNKFNNNIEKDDPINQINPINPRKQNDWNFTLSQYMILHNSKFEEIEKCLSSSDFRVKYAAILIVGEKNLNVGDKIFDLLDDRNEYVQQAARKALAVKSYFLMKQIKDFDLLGIKNNKNVKVNPNTLKVGKDYVDFGPLPQDSEDLILHATNRWREWFSIREKELKDMQDKKSNFFNGKN